MQDKAQLLPSEMPVIQHEVEYRTLRDLIRSIDALFADEEITDGLDDDMANLIIGWAKTQIQRAYHQANQFSVTARAIRQHARATSRIATMINLGVCSSEVISELRRQFPTLEADDFCKDVKRQYHISDIGESAE